MRAGVWAGALHVLPLLFVSLEKAKSTDYGSTACDCLGKTRLSPEEKKKRVGRYAFQKGMSAQK